MDRGEDIVRRMVKVEVPLDIGDESDEGLGVFNLCDISTAPSFFHPFDEGFVQVREPRSDFREDAFLSIDVESARRERTAIGFDGCDVFFLTRG
jgi:hypothetical protein